MTKVKWLKEIEPWKPGDYAVLTYIYTKIVCPRCKRREKRYTYIMGVIEVLDEDGVTIGGTRRSYRMAVGLGNDSPWMLEYPDEDDE